MRFRWAVAWHTEYPLRTAAYGCHVQATNTKSKMVHYCNPVTLAMHPAFIHMVPEPQRVWCWDCLQENVTHLFRVHSMFERQVEQSPCSITSRRRAWRLHHVLCAERQMPHLAMTVHVPAHDIDHKEHAWKIVFKIECSVAEFCVLIAVWMTALSTWFKRCLLQQLATTWQHPHVSKNKQWNQLRPRNSIVQGVTKSGSKPPPVSEGTFSHNTKQYVIMPSGLLVMGLYTIAGPGSKCGLHFTWHETQLAHRHCYDKRFQMIKFEGQRMIYA